MIGSNTLIIDVVWTYGDPNATGAVFGARESAYRRALALGAYLSTIDHRLYFNYNAQSNYLYYDGENLYGHIWSAHIENGNTRFLRDGTIIRNTTKLTDLFTTPFSMVLFGMKQKEPFVGNTRNVRIYSFSIKDGTTPTRDYIPVRVGNIGYMYDKVSKQLFGNSGTGNFILGPDK